MNQLCFEKVRVMFNWTEHTITWEIRVFKMEAECKMCGGKVSAPEDAIIGEIVSCSDCGH